MENKKDFIKVTSEMLQLYERKNKDYGDTFNKGYKTYGMIMPLIRLEDKFNRFKTLTMSSEQMVKDENISDT